LKIREWLKRLSNRLGNAKRVLSVYFLLLLIAFTYLPWSMQVDNGTISGKVFIKYSFIWQENSPLKIDFDRLIIEICILTTLLVLFLTSFGKKEISLRKPQESDIGSQVSLKNLSLTDISILSKESPEKLKELYELQDKYKKIEKYAEQIGKDVNTYLIEKGISEEAIEAYWRIMKVPRLKQ